MTERPFSDIAYNQYLNEEKLMGSRCRKCGGHFVPPRPMCTHCYSTDLEWVEVKGNGRLVAFTCITIAPPFMMAQGYDRKHPFACAFHVSVAVDVDFAPPILVFAGDALDVFAGRNVRGVQRQCGVIVFQGL